MAGYRRCAVRFQADVLASSGHSDPNFDVGVQLNNPVFREGESLVLSLAPTQPMWVQVFQWLPYEQTADQVRRLFPHSPDDQAFIQAPAVLPGRNYDYKMVLPPGGRKAVDEYVLVLASRQPLNLQDKYTLDDFSRLVAELPRGDSRLVRRSYLIVPGS